MKTAQYIPKFYIWKLLITFIKRSVSWLNKCKIVVVKLLIQFTQATFKIGCWSTLRYEIKQCFQKQITTWTRDVFSLLLRVVNIHILVIYTCKSFWYCFIFYEILRLPFWLKSSLILHFLAFHWQSHFLRERIHSKNLYKLFATFCSGRFDFHLQVIQPILKFPYLIPLIKYPKYVIWNKKIT